MVLGAFSRGPPRKSLVERAVNVFDVFHKAERAKRRRGGRIVMRGNRQRLRMLGGRRLHIPTSHVMVRPISWRSNRLQARRLV